MTHGDLAGLTRVEGRKLTIPMPHVTVCPRLRFVPGLQQFTMSLFPFRLYDIINLQEDQVLFVPMCERCASQIEALGRPVEAHDAMVVVIVT
jgi:hypothetical protein